MRAKQYFIRNQSFFRCRAKSHAESSAASTEQQLHPTTFPLVLVVQRYIIAVWNRIPLIDALCVLHFCWFRTQQEFVKKAQQQQPLQQLQQQQNNTILSSSSSTLDFLWICTFFSLKPQGSNLET